MLKKLWLKSNGKWDSITNNNADGSLDSIDTSEFVKISQLTEVNGDIPTKQELIDFNNVTMAQYVKLEDLTEVDISDILSRIEALEAKVGG